MFFNEFSYKTVQFGEVSDPRHKIFITNFEKGGQYLFPNLITIFIIIFQKGYINFVSKLFTCLGYLLPLEDDVDLKEIQVNR
jgi:hypothetical protein